MLKINFISIWVFLLCVASFALVWLLVWAMIFFVKKGKIVISHKKNTYGKWDRETFLDRWHSLNTAKLIDCYGTFPVQNLAILSISGGYGVILADLLEKFGLSVPTFSAAIQEKLDEKFFTLGTSSTNPLNVSAQIYDRESIYDIIDIALSDEKIDGLVMDLPTWYFNMDYHLTKDKNFEPTMKKAFGLGHKHNKPLIPIIQRVKCPEVRLRIVRELSEQKIPAFGDPSEFIPLLPKISRQFDKISGKKLKD